MVASNDGSRLPETLYQPNGSNSPSTSGRSNQPGDGVITYENAQAPFCSLTQVSTGPARALRRYSLEAQPSFLNFSLFLETFIPHTGASFCNGWVPGVWEHGLAGFAAADHGYPRHPGIGRCLLNHIQE